MIRGTTPRHVFALPFHTDTLAKVRVIYSQGGRVVLAKCDEDLILEENQVTVLLTQEDTLAFRCGLSVDIQLRVLTHTGEALASKIIHAPVERCLENEVMV